MRRETGPRWLTRVLLALPLALTAMACGPEEETSKSDTTHEHSEDPPRSQLPSPEEPEPLWLRPTREPGEQLAPHPCHNGIQDARETNVDVGPDCPEPMGVSPRAPRAPSEQPRGPVRSHAGPLLFTLASENDADGPVT